MSLVQLIKDENIKEIGRCKLTIKLFQNLCFISNIDNCGTQNKRYTR